MITNSFQHLNISMCILLFKAEIKVVLKDSSERFCKCLDAFKSARYDD